MENDIIMRKLDSLTRYVKRIEQKRPSTLKGLVEDIDLQDILSINLERAIQVSVDIGAHIIADLTVPPPKTMGEVFIILVSENIISKDVGLALRQAVGFRNLSVHAYDQVDWERVFEIVQERINIFPQFAQAVMLYMNREN